MKLAEASGVLVATLLVFIIIASAVGLVAGLIIYYLWNWLMPIIFKLPEITFWQAWGLWVFSNIMFKINLSSEKKEK
jgi:uncharacterized membrane protein YidH (DUF202 family)